MHNTAFFNNFAPIKINDKTIVMPKILTFLLFFCIVHLGLARDLRVIYPQYTKVELRCQNTVPSGQEVSLSCAAGFTEGYSPRFSHDRISNSHTSAGKFYKTKTHPKMGTFTWYNGQHHFSFDGEVALRKAAKNKGMGFQQFMIFYNGAKYKFRAPKSKEYWRTLCEIKGKLCIVESDEKETFDDYLKKLRKLHPTQAMYLDTGYGWNHYYYNGKHVHNVTYFPFTTNYITFTK